MAPFRIAAVRYLNSRPLIHGLDQQPDISLTLDVPAKLLSRLQSQGADIALLPVIDYPRMDGLRIVPAGGIGCDGPTLTVRIFSPVPIEQITTLACDRESHTSVALARIILAHRYNLAPELIDLPADAASRPRGAMLLIGDKVITHAPAGMEHQLDLGQAWKEMTGLPFVFAVWTARAGVDLGDLPRRLEDAKRQGLAAVDSIVEQYAAPLGWPRDLARQYLSVNLCFDIGQPQLQAIAQFHEMAAGCKLIPQFKAFELYR